MPRKSNKSPKQNLQALQQPEIKKFNDNLNWEIKENIKNEFKDHKEIIYLCSVNNYEIENKRVDREDPKLNIDVFKMKPKFKNYHNYIKYCDDYYIMGFPEDEEIYLLRCEQITNLILYCSNTANELYNMDKKISKLAMGITTN